MMREILGHLRKVAIASPVPLLPLSQVPEFQNAMRATERVKLASVEILHKLNGAHPHPGVE